MFKMSGKQFLSFGSNFRLSAKDGFLLVLD